MADARKKWSCEYCTYQNFEAAIKCTLCHASRGSPLIITDLHNEEQDIYKMAVKSGNNRENSEVICSSKLNKWNCRTCTYLNWPKAVRCVQCYTPKNKKSSPPSASPTHEKVPSGPLSGEAITPRKTPPHRDIPSSPKAANKTSNNDINRQKTYARVKWICKSCTYENWPRSFKCCICGTSKGRTSPEITNTILSCENSPTSGSPTGSGCASGVQSSLSDTSLATAVNNQEDNKSMERKLKQIKKRMREKDWLWLNACVGVVEGEAQAVEAYIASGGDPYRQLSQDEAAILNRPSAFQPGYTLVHLGIRFKREDMLAVLLTSTESATNCKKRLPSHISPDLAADIRRLISASLRQRKGEFPCQIMSESVTFSLPTGINNLPSPVQTQLFDEVLDNDVQKELEEDLVINWSKELTERLGSRLYALWNRTAGDCLLDSVLQATWGIFDTDNTLRNALSESLSDAAMMFYPRWKEYESYQAEMLQFSLDEAQWQNDWALLLSIASQPGAALEQTHIFCLSHILRRPIIVYGIKYVKSFRGETLGFARFQGIYLPLLWEKSFCWKSPIALAYTRGHFSSLVTMEMVKEDLIGAGANVDNNDDESVAYLPVVDYEGKLLPVPFLKQSEIGREESILHEWLDICVTKAGHTVALQKLGQCPLVVKQMVEEWLDHYRHISHQIIPQPGSLSSQTFSSDGESDQE